MTKTVGESTYENDNKLLDQYQLKFHQSKWLHFCIKVETQWSKALVKESSPVGAFVRVD